MEQNGEDLMRADRLLSILLLLQARGRMTAADLAKEMEVSERTIYRDVDALSVAGVPIYGERGPEGGYALLDSYRTTLTGLTAGEVRALFMLSVPAPLAELGVDRELRTALRKLAAVLAGAHHGDEERVRQRIHLDATWWSREVEPVPHLTTVHEAVWQDRKLYVRYRQVFGTPAVIERQVDPYGLVAKAGIWHLVCARNERIRVHRISRLLDVRACEATFERPADFDLAAFWKAWCARTEQERSGYAVRVRVAPDLIESLPHYFGAHIRAAIARAEPPDEAGWIELELQFENMWAARDRLLGFGRAIEVLAPEPLRLSLVDFARQIVDLYAGRRGLARP
jgi:predicted DNA-binding transcriptional regulator YafY